LALLISLYRFFTSEAVKEWIRLYFVANFSWERNVAEEESYLHEISQWIEKTNINMRNPINLSLDVNLQKVLDWSREIQAEPQALGQFVGKAAVAVWLHDDIDDSRKIRRAFLLALKYYWKRPNRSFRKMEEMKRLATTRFRDMRAWAVQASDRSVLVKNIGVALFALRQWKESIACFESELKTNPTRFTFWRELGEAYKANGDNDSTISTIEVALHHDYENRRLLRLVVDAYMTKGDYDGVIRLMDSVAVKMRGRDLPWSELRRAFEAKGDHDGAIRRFEAEVDRFPGANWAWEELRRAYQGKGDCASLIRRLKSAVSKYPRNQILWENLGAVYRHQGDDNLVIEMWKTAVGLNPPDHTTGVNIQIVRNDAYLYPEGPSSSIHSLCIRHLGEAYMATGDYVMAVRTEISEVSPVETLEYMSWALSAKGDYDKEIELLEIALQQSQNDRFVWGGLSNAWTAKGDYDRAIDIRREAVNKHITKPWAWRDLGYEYLHKGDYDAAIETFRSAIRMFPSAESLLVGLGDVYLASGHFDMAINVFNACIDQFLDIRLTSELWQEDGELWQVLASAYMTTGKYDMAITVYKTGIERFPDDYTLARGLAFAYLEACRTIRRYKHSILASTNFTVI